jgi:pyruvate dehydrogenase E1 component alpha subunit
LIEAKTYRYRGHSRTDAAPYRKPGELDEWLAKDPITILSDRMIADHQITPEGLDGLWDETHRAVQAATEFAMEQPYPPLEAAYEDIWV